MLDGRLGASPKWGTDPIGGAGTVAQTGPMSSLSRRSARRTAPLPPDLERRRRPTLRTKLRTAWSADELDEALANGADPLASDELTLRADQLVKPTTRVELAQTLELIVEQVGCGGPSPLPGPTILRREPIARNCPGLLTLAQRLRRDGLQCLPGLAMADRMIRYGDTPLYMGLDPQQLMHRIEEILAALEPGWDGVPADMPHGDGR
jgi:hypothetical protein